jgi:hypothetical protein
VSTNESETIMTTFESLAALGPYELNIHAISIAANE